MRWICGHGWAGGRGEMISDMLVQWLACLTIAHEVAGSIPGTSTEFKCGLGLERGPPILARSIGKLLD